MAAIGQGGGGTGSAAGAPGSPGAPAAGAPGGGAGPENTDPFGFAAAAAGAPDHLRPMLQTEFDRLAPQLNERLAPFEPLHPYMDRLGPLLQPGQDNGQPTPPILEGLLELFDMTQDESRVEDLADWWQNVGQSFGFFDDEDGTGTGDGTGTPPPGDESAGAGAGAVELDPNNPLTSVVTELREQLGQLTQRLDGQEQQTAQQTAVQETQTRINNELTTGMRALGLLKPDAPLDLEAQETQDILGLALKYGSDKQGIPKAIADYARMTGKGGQQLLNDAGADTAGVEALRAAMAAGAQVNGNGDDGGGLPGAGPSLRGGAAASGNGDAPTWGTAKIDALARLRAQGQ